MSKKYPKPEWLAAAQCTGKHRFEDGGLAKQIARQSSRRKDSKATAYKCPICGGWHVGNGRNNPDKRKM